ncbi:MAG: septum formation inhibitor Maf [Oscillospiraceae bacterium]|nr:septum formation inhibitor Maf [Oscillospiraceae bacterium]
MLILASQSPRRKELLSLMRLPFEIRVADIDETMDKTLSIADGVAELSRRKANAIPREPEDIVIAADTIVVLDDKVLGKPKDTEDARQMLTALSGRTHQVMTGFTVCRGEEAVSHTEITDVTFRKRTEKDIEAYIATGDPMDKAGSYGIQNGAALFVEKLCGDYYNVMGLPICRLSQILEAFL